MTNLGAVPEWNEQNPLEKVGQLGWLEEKRMVRMEDGLPGRTCKWSITMVIVSPLTEVFLFPNDLL